ncbi:CRISPR-associated endoribonuclease Cas6 [Caldanaerobius polysaccharolyticus]|uniref:CRISPR-associated endoribonuclease Cas6 n=1 Tax=Caldanaerobius polysaccharolyticus TaxID=44256 RepID=UPI00047E17F5|nr:CRISPR-associated endoribonuclease Cas6 [Caldanaerobius polysaccharolyticus]
MRVRLEFDAEKDLVLPVQYNSILQGFIYHNIRDENYSQFLHDEGYKYGKRKLKFFTFSRIEGRVRVVSGKIYIKPPFSLIISSPIEQFIHDLAENIFRKDRLYIGNQGVVLRKLDVYSPIEFGSRVKIKMLSPAVMYSTIDSPEGKYTHYYSPWDNVFSYLARRNIEMKYEIITGFRPEKAEFRIIPTGPKDDRYQKVLNFKGTVIKGWMGTYYLEGDSELIKLAYDAGICSKNSEGFGCFEVIK